jgi:hypothetical protein
MKPFLTDRPHIDTPPVRAAAASAVFTHNGPTPSAALATHEAHAGSGGGPRIDCVREGDRITRIVVTCGCGERIEIDCLYAAGR